MSATSGRFVWRELVTPALEQSRSFYTDLFGWKVTNMDMGGAPYTVYAQGDAQVAGMMAPTMAGVPPFWLDYITVDDVDVSRAQVIGLGGTAVTEALDIPNMGRFAVVRDPAGAMFALFSSLTPGASGDGAAAVGTFCWSMLMTTDLDRVAPFYAALFGWEPKMLGNMVVFGRNGRDVSSAMTAQMGMASHWLPYVAVDDCDAVADRARGLGATQYVAPTDMPGMGRFAVLADPGGAVVALWKDAGARS